MTRTLPPIARRCLALAAVATVLAIAAGCATRPEVHHAADPRADLSSYRSFAFDDPLRLSASTPLEQQLRRATREQLERCHLVYDERDPDLRVVYALNVVDRQELRSTPGGWGWRGRVETIDVRQGSLRIDLVDARRQWLVWRAVAEGRLGRDAMAQPSATVDAAVGELFARLPDVAAR